MKPSPKTARRRLIIAAAALLATIAGGIFWRLPADPAISRAQPVQLGMGLRQVREIMGPEADMSITSWNDMLMYGDPRTLSVRIDEAIARMLSHLSISWKSSRKAPTFPVQITINFSDQVERIQRGREIIETEIASP